MRKYWILFFTLFLFLTGCAAADDTPDTQTESTAAPVIPGREDRGILDDYKNIVPSGEHTARILFINAGKADAILVQIDEKNYLIDTGTAASVPVIEAALDHIGVESLDGVFISHTDNDHTGGYAALAEMYQVGKVYTSSISSDWMKIENLRGETERVSLDPGAVAELAEGVYFEVLGPIRYNPADDNNNSLVLRLQVNGVTALFAGDMMYDEETSLLYSEMPLDCDILKVGYHGCKQASSESFIRAASPSVAVISTDRDEDEGSAHKSVIKLLEKENAEVHITDESELGVLVTIETDGTIRTENYEAPEESRDVRFTVVSKADQLVTIRNFENDAVDLTGWTVISVRGREMFAFPEGTVIGAGESLTIACREYNGEYDLMWEENRVWHKDKKDNAVIIDCWGNRVHEQLSE
ncbi:MAG: MBL fold metallo-hydrolase [Clostridia bacterium]|nr:MBL fold metallo-hydrolase [Clostridia bacterium]